MEFYLDSIRSSNGCKFCCYFEYKPNHKAEALHSLNLLYKNGQSVPWPKEKDEEAKSQEIASISGKNHTIGYS